MYGRTIGTLNLYQVVGQTETLIWTLSGNKGNSWFSGQVPVGKKLFNGYKVCQNHVVWNKRTSYSISFEKNREGSKKNTVLFGCSAIMLCWEWSLTMIIYVYVTYILS